MTRRPWTGSSSLTASCSLLSRASSPAFTGWIQTVRLLQIRAKPSVSTRAATPGGDPSLTERSAVTGAACRSPETGVPASVTQRVTWDGRGIPRVNKLAPVSGEQLVRINHWVAATVSRAPLTSAQKHWAEPAQQRRPVAQRHGRCYGGDRQQGEPDQHRHGRMVGLEATHSRYHQGQPAQSAQIVGGNLVG